VNSVGQLAWMLIEFALGCFPLPGASTNDLKNLPDNWKKSVALEFFLKYKARCAPSSMMVFVSNPFKPATLFQQQKRVARKCSLRLKFLTAQNDLFCKRLTALSFRMYPFKLHPNDFLIICPKNNPFFAEILKTEEHWLRH
jgi:hypothetical protein